MSALEKVYDLPYRQVRAELEAMTDTEFAKEHGINRMQAGLLRRQLDVPAHPKGPTPKTKQKEPHP